MQADRSHRVSGALPAVAAVRIIAVDDGGAHATALPVTRSPGGSENRILIAGTDQGPPLQAGERVLARLSKIGPDRYAGTVMRRIGSLPERIVGTLQRSGGGYVLHSADRRPKRPIDIDTNSLAGAKAGDMVAVQIRRQQHGAAQRGHIVEVLGSAGEVAAFTALAIHEHGIPDQFPEDALALADRLQPPGIDGNRVDLRDVPFITIDDEDARDFDDAVWAEADPACSGGWRILVAIADVAHYVRPGDALDVEAQRRGNSVYFPDQVVPMLPERLSNDLCSLKPGEDRACLAVELRIDGSGRKTAHRFLRGLMRSVARVTYQGIQRTLDGTDTTSSLAPLARRLHGAFQALHRARTARGALEIDMPEPRVTLDDAGVVLDLRVRPRLESHRLIEELMILANVAAAETLRASKQTGLYRVHEMPAASGLLDLRRVLKELGITARASGDMRPALFNRILEAALGTTSSDLVQMLVLRAQNQARYSTGNPGHFGLGLECYTHFTSPIRRYADLLVHRLLCREHGFGDRAVDRVETHTLDKVCLHLSEVERRAAEAERAVVNRCGAVVMTDRIGQAFDVTVAGVARFGLFVTMGDSPMNALLPVGRLPADHYHLDSDAHELAGSDRGLRFRLGQTLTVILREVNVLAGRLTVDYVDGAIPGKPSRGSGAARGHRGRARRNQGS